MSIGGLGIGLSGIRASQVGLDVAGQNIANVNNPHYTRQRARLESEITIQRPFGDFGMGVRVRSIDQVKDDFIGEEIRNQTSAAKKDEVLFNAYERLQGIYEEGAGFGLNERLGNFFNSFQDLANFPEDSGMRQAVLGQAELLTSQFQFLNSELDKMRLDLNSEVGAMVQTANTLVQQVADLNSQIVQIEADGISNANDLRDSRDKVLSELAELIDIKTVETDDGAVNVSTQGRSLVFANDYNLLATRLDTADDLPVHNVIMAGTSDSISFTGGEIAGALAARDTEIPGFISKLDTLAETLIERINLLHSDGRGLVGYTSVTGANAVDDTTADLDSTDAGLSLTPVDGSFDIILINSTTGAETTVTISVDLDGTDPDDSLDDLATSIDAADANLSATVNADGTLTIAAASGYEIGFSNDNSNVLAALGINSFLTGTSAADISVNSELVDNPSLVAAARSGNPGDNSNALDLAQLRSTLVLTDNTQTFEGYYQAEISRLGSQALEQDTSAQASALFLDQLVLRRQNTSGVSLDEETADLIRFQQSLQASARYINVVNQMLNVLVNGLV